MNNNKIFKVSGHFDEKQFDEKKFDDKYNLSKSF